MCVWLIAACLSIVPPQNNYNILIPQIIGAPPPILVPTNPPTTTTTAATAANFTFMTSPMTTAAATTTTVATTTTLPTTTTTTTTTTTVRPVVTLPPLTPVSSPPTPGITSAPGVSPSQQPIPNIDPRSPPPLKFYMGTDDNVERFGGEDYQDIVIEIDIKNEPIIFPKSKRSISSKRQKRQSFCGCVLPAQCPSNTSDGSGVIDFRIVSGGNNVPQCVTGLRYCCVPSTTPAPTTPPPTTTPLPTTTVTPTPQQSCGSRIQVGITYPTQAGQARYGDYPWMVVILTSDNLYIGGAVLIDMQHVLTAAHRIANYTIAGLKVRLGEWDAAGNYEQYPYRDYTLSRVWIHESFNPNNLYNNIALIRITGGVPVGTPAIVPICLPAASQNFDGQRCYVSGWGKNSFGVTGLYQTVLKAVDVPVIPQTTCENTFRTTRLGPTFVLDRTSFICAGGELDKDACTGDGGSGLVCESTPGKWTLAGLVAWGLGCASQGIPGAYVNVVSYLPWISTRQISL